MAVDVDLFQTLADPSRRKIVETLRDGEQSVNEIVAAIGLRQPGVSRHLRILGDAGFVHVRPSGTRRLYSLRAEPFHQLDEWVTTYQGLWESRIDRLASSLDRMQQRATNPKAKEPT